MAHIRATRAAHRFYRDPPPNLLHELSIDLFLFIRVEPVVQDDNHRAAATESETGDVTTRLMAAVQPPPHVTKSLRG